ncbi:MAG TPA: hypothetical protein VF194_18605 [Ferrovibrio sp.]|uniref:hypothetical protein n=1 Tax=Ferrovibrio sp. TaxID=1917215 RepID=UPI002ED529B0
MSDSDSRSPLQRVGDFLFGREERRPAGAAKSRAIERRPAEPKILPSAPPLPSRMQAGTLQLVGLDYIRRALAETWESHRDKVHAVVESTFRRYLEPADAYYKIDDERFLVLFTRLARPQAEAKATAIAREVQRLVLGELPAGHDVTVKSRVAEVDRKLLMEKVSTLEQLLEFVETGQLAPEDGGGIALFENLGADEPPPAAAAVTGPGPDMADLDQSLAALWQKTSAAQYLKQCSVRFDPVFSTRRKAFTAFDVRILHRGAMPQEDDMMLVDDPEALQFHLDRYALLSGALGLQHMLTQTMQALIVMPVHFSTLATAKTRNVYLQRLREVPQSFKRFIGFSITGVAPGTPPGRIADILSYLQPLSIMQGMRLPADPKLVDLYAAAGVQSLAVSAAETMAGGETAHQQGVDLAAFARRVRAHQMDSVLLDIDDADMLRLGLGGGFSLLAGAAVARGAAEPALPEAQQLDRLAGLTG